ncbi:XTP/dITP diphosphatase [Caldiplasma sukawensis]
MILKFVTHNEHKFLEVKQYAEKKNIKIEWINIEYDEIQADTTEEISRRSAEDLYKKIEGPFFLEDTGLYIESLNGFPGPYSSYVQKKIGNEGILKLMNGISKRNAFFVTVISYCNEGKIDQFVGRVEGNISTKPSGVKGFGYDPIFIPVDSKKSLAEMTVDEKNMLSHRIRALEKFMEWLNKGSN